MFQIKTFLKKPYILIYWYPFLKDFCSGQEEATLLKTVMKNYDNEYEWQLYFNFLSDIFVFKTLVNIFMYDHACLGVHISDTVICKSVLEHCAIHYSNLTIVTFQILQCLGTIQTISLQLDPCKLIPLSGPAVKI